MEVVRERGGSAILVTVEHVASFLSHGCEIQFPQNPVHRLEIDNGQAGQTATSIC
jgi:hypothetical protein